jgi:DNA polymerase-3 subunit beta
MKLSVARSELFDALSVVGKGMSARSTLPILAGVLLTAQDGELQLESTDLEVSVRRTAPVLIENEGSAVLPGRLLSEIVRSLPEAAVTIETDGDLAHVRCHQSSFTVKTLSAKDFPKFPQVAVDKSFTLKSAILSEAVRKVSRSVSRDETRATLTGVLVVVEGPVLRMVATDSYRLAVCEVLLDEPTPESIEVIVPGKALDEVSRLGAEADDVSVGLSENQVVFTLGSTTFVTRRIEGNFPNYRQIIPKDSATHIEIQGEELISAVKRVSLMALHNSPIKLAVNTADQTLSLSAATQDVGDASEDLLIKTEGEDIGIAFNHSFLMDGLNSAGSETIRLEIKGQDKPGLIKSAAGEDFFYVLMPVRTT